MTNESSSACDNWYIESPIVKSETVYYNVYVQFTKEGRHPSDQKLLKEVSLSGPLLADPRKMIYAFAKEEMLVGVIMMLTIEFLANGFRIRGVETIGSEPNNRMIYQEWLCVPCRGE